MGTIRVVYDTNVFISGIGFGGKPWQCLLYVFLGDVELLVSKPILEEFRRVLAYDRLPFTETERERFPELIEAEATLVEPTAALQVIEDDPDDDKFIECAVSGGADYVVSGDSHLTEFGEFRDMPILDPDVFLAVVETDG